MIASDNIEKIINDTILDDKTVDEVVESKEDKEISKPVEKPAVEKKKTPYKIGIISSNTADVKTEPDKYADLITILKKGDAVIIDDDSDKEYYKVTANIKVGYILKNQITIK